MKRILLALTIVAIALAVAADESKLFELIDEELPVQDEVTDEPKGTEGTAAPVSSATSVSTFL